MNGTLLILTGVMSVAAFCMMGIDKHRAKRGAWRISERTLLSTAAFFGAPGAIAGMYLFRHKTRHARFSIGLPVMLAVQLTLLLVLK